MRRDAMPTTIRVVIRPAEDVGGYWAKSVTIAGAFTQGDTIQETEKNMYESVDLLLEDDYPEITDYTLEFEVRDA
jgi:predicted RNase H-like HicB family nuclease